MSTDSWIEGSITIGGREIPVLHGRDAAVRTVFL